MKKLISLFLILLSFGSQLLGQKLDGYKYVSIPHLNYQELVGNNDLNFQLRLFFSNKGFILLPENRKEWPADAQLNPCLTLYFSNLYVQPQTKVGFKIVNCKNEILFDEKENSTSYFRSMKRCLNAIDKLDYSFKSTETPELQYPEVERTNETEESIKKYLLSNNLDPLEGIYQTYKSKYAFFYKVAIIKNEDKYKAIILESFEKQWEKGLVKAVFEPSSASGLYSVTWNLANRTPYKTFGRIENENLISVDFKDGNTVEKEYLVKMYPESANNSSKKNDDKKNTAFGSGFFVTSNGIVATNAHVVENASNIEITVSSEKGVYNYKTKLLLIDKINDVALLQVDDEKFQPFVNIPYSIIDNSEVGSKVFTIGFPLNSVMGNNYKVNDGIISAKSGIRDDIRYYQISVPLQPGNSGGPLFNKDGNIIGITSSRLNGEAVGTQIENVNYAVKSSYLLSLYYMLPNSVKFETSTQLANKELQEQVKILKSYVCIIKAF